METPRAPAPFLFSSAEGYALCRRILRPLLPYDPHDYQLEGICKALDGVDVLAILPTGSGKTGLLSMFLLVVRALAQDPSLCPTAKKFPKNPAILVICPTNFIEHQIVRDNIY
jgi:superfamily II DNA/RNA helicase